MIHDSILGTIGNTPVIRINRLAPAGTTIYVKCEAFNPMSSVKDRLAIAMIEDAERRGTLKPGQTVIEPTSGNTGIALAMVCAVKGYPFVAIMADSFSVERRKLMKALGAKVVLSPAANRGSGMVKQAEELAKKHGWFLPQQFENPSNPEYHRNTTGPEILRDFAGKRLDYFVSGSGTGGTITGAGEMLKKARPDIKIVFTEPAGAPLVSEGKWAPHKIQGWTTDFVPGVLNTKIFDETVLVTDVESRDAARELSQKEGIFCGISSGATFAAARKVAEKAPKGSVLLAMLPDTGERYLSTILFEGITEDSDALPADRRRTLLAAERATESLSRHGRTRVALGFPNSYEIGMSNLGFQWVYRLFNREDDIACDRFFVEDDGDLRGPRTLETDTPLGDFPLVAFSISWEMDYVNFLRLLPAARIPLERTDRGEGDPIVLVGGDCARINPAPLSHWVDAFAMGDGEKLVPAIADVLRSDLSRDGTIAALAEVKGLYVPAVHGARAEAADEGKVVVQQFKSAEGPRREPPHTTILTPHTELSDKLLVEIARGCSEMCRFCWAAYAMAPQVRVSAESVLEVARRNRPLTSRVGLIATAVADHPEILPILRGLAALEYHIALSSVKIDAISEEILAILTAQGERALAIAPEAGNERLRRAINKKVSDEMLFEKVRLIARSGITQLKLYLQIGLPGETDADVDDVVGLVDRLREVFLVEGRLRGRVGTLVPTVNAFIPKPHTPFENESLDDPAALEEKMKRLDAAFRKMPNVTFRGMPVVEAIWEAWLAKMGEESTPILLEAAAGAPVRRLVRNHRETLLAVVRPQRQTLSEHDPALPRGVFDPHARQSAPWGFIAKS